MKLSNFLLGSLIVLLFCNCGAKKKTAKANTQKIRIEYSEIYCGGAAPPPEMLREMMLLKPFANQEVEVYSSKAATDTAVVYKTNNKGELWVPVTESTSLLINIYPPKESDDPVYDQCYKAFIFGNLLTVDLTTKKEVVKVVVVKQCNPCDPAAP